MKKLVPFFAVVLFALILFNFRHHKKLNLQDESANSQEKADFNPFRKGRQGLVISQVVLKKSNTISSLNESNTDTATGRQVTTDPSKSSRRKVLSRVSMTPELWEIKKNHLSPYLRQMVERSIESGNFKMPKTGFVTNDDEEIVSSTELQSANECPALNTMPLSLTLSINQSGEVQDAINTDPDNNTPVPPEIFNCKFQPAQADQAMTKPVMTTFVPPSEIQSALQASLAWLSTHPVQKSQH